MELLARSPLDRDADDVSDERRPPVGACRVWRWDERRAYGVRSAIGVVTIARRSDNTDADEFADDFIIRLRSVPRTTPSLRAELKRISKEIALLNSSRVLRLAHDFIRAGIPRFVAYELVLNHKQTIASIGPAEVERLGEGIGGWADIDTFSCFISGRAWRAGRIPDSLIQLWARSDDWRWRRVALVSTVPLNSRAGRDGRR